MFSGFLKKIILFLGWVNFCAKSEHSVGVKREHISCFLFIYPVAKIIEYIHHQGVKSSKNLAG